MIGYILVGNGGLDTYLGVVTGGFGCVEEDEGETRVHKKNAIGSESPYKQGWV